MSQDEGSRNLIGPRNIRHDQDFISTYDWPSSISSSQDEAAATNSSSPVATPKPSSQVKALNFIEETWRALINGSKDNQRSLYESLNITHEFSELGNIFKAFNSSFFTTQKDVESKRTEGHLLLMKAALWGCLSGRLSSNPQGTEDPIEKDGGSELVETAVAPGRLAGKKQMQSAQMNIDDNRSIVIKYSYPPKDDRVHRMDVHERYTWPQSHCGKKTLARLYLGSEFSSSTVTAVNGRNDENDPSGVISSTTWTDHIVDLCNQIEFPIYSAPSQSRIGYVCHAEQKLIAYYISLHVPKRDSGSFEWATKSADWDPQSVTNRYRLYSAALPASLARNSSISLKSTTPSLLRCIFPNQGL